MSAVTGLPTRSKEASTSVPMTTLVGVELRKMVDTRAGRWLLIGVAAVTVLVLGIALATGDAGTRSFTNLFSLAQLPLSILIPVLGVLAATSEWSQRTVLTTFALVPSRSRIVSAKVLAAMSLALLTVVFALVVAAAAAAVAPIFGAVDSDWSLPIGDLLQVVVYQQLNMLLGVALGTLLLNSALAIVLYFVLPTIWSGLTDSISALADAQRWLDTSTTWMRLVDPDVAMTGTHWAQAGATALLWIAVPLAIGVTRILRREVD
ncbi:MAG: ABC transporter permease subunit [Solirubrobacteraceae bacterium]|nr:ABC transporter permease subunit [Solirubrobacteraceae bacterium]